MMIDFTNMVRKNKTFNGASGNKLSIIYNDEQYMLKFAPVAKKNKNMSYSNSTISEYIGSNIYKVVGIPVQETILCEYKVKDKIKKSDFGKNDIFVWSFIF
ncbi:MAG: hypothetical protein IKT40_00650 [Bacilli bacterium]|nr:hypothetical protein [Bacilli bacterium]